MADKNNSAQRVLILCTGNSCRSQMAEGLINHQLGREWRAESAGTQPSGYVHPLAVRALAELDIDLLDPHISRGRSKSTEEFRDTQFDQVITVCDDAAENCPVWLGSGQVAHIGFPDPALAQGSDDEKMVEFRKVRDAIRQQLLPFLQQTTDHHQVDEAPS